MFFTLNAFATHGKSVKLVNTPYLNGERLLVIGARLSCFMLRCPRNSPEGYRENSKILYLSPEEDWSLKLRRQILRLKPERRQESEGRIRGEDNSVFLSACKLLVCMRRVPSEILLKKCGDS